MIPLPLPTFIPRYVSPRGSIEPFGHGAFKHDLIIVLRPSLYVSLDVRSGTDYFGVCQTILEGGLGCVSYGVGVGEREDNDADELAAYNAHHYESFSRLLGSQGESLHHFSDSSIGVLQIGNGRDVQRTFEAWLPKVKPGGVILVEGITDRNSAGQAWRLWEGVASTFSERFAFHHAGGLGVLRKSGLSGATSPFLDGLFNCSGERCEYIRRHYVIYGGYLDSILRVDHAASAMDRKVNEMMTELRAAQHERLILESELAQAQLELTRTHHERNEAKRRIEALQTSIAAGEAAHAATRLQMQQVSQALETEQQAKRDLIGSFSWKVTAPARDFMEWTRRRKAK